jgi:Asp-tRNA(Asn)/Glu-tRNA(Gln) amidotransferase A subunit family amidase
MKVVKYLTACRRKQELQHEWQKLARRFDVMVVPSGPAVAPPHGSKTIEVENENFPIRPLLNRFTRPFNLLGWPVLSLPNGISDEGLPTGLQVAGPPYSEGRVLIMGYRLEEALGLVKSLRIEPRCWLKNGKI